MKVIRKWDVLAQYGIVWLTGESCGLGMRMLCGVTEPGKRVLEKCFGCTLQLSDAWNRCYGTHIGSIMLAPEMLFPIGVFALLENGCYEVVQLDRALFGIEPVDAKSEAIRLWDAHGSKQWRTYRYAGPAGAGDRNVHQMTGRVE